MSRGRFGVEPICKTLGVSVSAYYQRRGGRRSDRAVDDERLLARIRELHAANCAHPSSRDCALARERSARGMHPRPFACGIGISARCAVDQKRRKSPHSIVHAGRMPGDLAGHLTCGDLRLQAGLAGHFRRGMRRSPRSTELTSTEKDADLQVFYGSDRTRTRDLRRDRPVLVVPS